MGATPYLAYRGNTRRRLAIILTQPVTHVF